MSIKTPTAIASSTQLSADASTAIVQAGGNAVDAAIAASLVAIVTEPGICSFGCGGYITILPPGQDPLTIDGNIEMPGRSRNSNPESYWEVRMDYGGGISTLVGHGSVGTPGGLAAYEEAWKRYGSLPWKELFQPAIRHLEAGFPLSSASCNYLQYSHQCVYGWLPESAAILQDDKAQLLPKGELIIIPHLADSLRNIADAGADTFYRGDLATLIAKDFDQHHGQMSARDLASYSVKIRKPISIELGPWSLATNPPPAVGGASLFAMLELTKRCADRTWTPRLTAEVTEIQRQVLMHRYAHLDLSDDLTADLLHMLKLAKDGSIPVSGSAPSTVHTSGVDSNGLACSITMSSGYGSGVMPPGTGIWMNNCVGETELNRKGFEGPAGRRLASNMAPTVGRHQDGAVLSIGSPGADRITSALLCTLLSYTKMGLSLEQAIAHPRLHIEIVNGSPRLAFERGQVIDEVRLPTRGFDEPSMFFGGVGATLLTNQGELQAAADPRRSGGRRITRQEISD